MLCRNCGEKNFKFWLPVLPVIPEALQQLQPIEQHLIAMARISQVLLDKLPAGGPSAQWGRMYAVLVDEPYICDVLEGATLEEDGTAWWRERKDRWLLQRAWIAYTRHCRS